MGVGRRIIFRQPLFSFIDWRNMNIFVLDDCPKKAAEYYADKHVVKIILEIAQMATSAIRRHGGLDEDVPTTKSGNPMKASYQKHPVTLWVGNNLSNYNWTIAHMQSLCEEYTHRYNKHHYYEQFIDLFLESGQKYIPSGDLEPFATAMPDECKLSNPVMSYRKYYKDVKKLTIPLSYTRRNIPEFLK